MRPFGIEIGVFNIHLSNKVMKKLLIVCMVVVLAGCSAQKEAANTGVTYNQTEYEVTIMDPDFERWYLMRYSPAMERSNDYYTTMVTRGVNNWNDFYMRNRYRRAVNSYINFQPGIDHGIEVNRRLYWYFRYIEETYRVPLLR